MSFFNDKQGGQDIRDYHLFVTTHPYFIELGLGVFTTGTLINWWNEQDGNGRFLNRRHINSLLPSDPDPLDSPTNDLNKLIGVEEDTEFFWYGWKPNLTEQNDGYYKKQNLKGIIGSQGGDDADRWGYAGAVAANANTINTACGFLSGRTPMIGLTLDDNSFPVVEYAVDPTPTLRPLTTINPLYGIIQGNFYINSYKDYYPFPTWDKNDPTTHPGLDKEIVFGGNSFFTEIKAGKLGNYIQWSGDITFYVNQPGLLENCPITENVEFKLYLSDQTMIPGNNNQTKTVVQKSPQIFVAPKKDALGTLYNESIDGERSEAEVNNVSTHAAAELEMSYNSVTKKMEAGNKNMFAVLTTPLGFGKTPELNGLLNRTIKENLDDPNPTFRFLPTSGFAIPISAQNGNPLQLQPNYRDLKGKRCQDDNVEKEQIVVYNYNTKYQYPSGQEVMLTKIEGLWHVTDMGTPASGEEEGTGPVTAGIGAWRDFSYFMTNTNHYFVVQTPDQDANLTALDPRTSELAFHYRYYKSLGDALNTGKNYGASGGYDETIFFNTEGGISTAQGVVDYSQFVHEWGYCQHTSFDYLDSRVGGTRYGFGQTDACSISSTNARVNAFGSEIPGDGDNITTRNAAHCGVFHGCLFPGGYVGGDEYKTTSVPRNTNLVPTSNIQHLPEVYLTKILNTEAPFAQEDGNLSRNNHKNPTQVAWNTAFQSEFDASWNRKAQKGVNANIFNRNQTMANMPADVMLNGSPSSEVGGPIRPLQRTRHFFDTVDGNTWKNTVRASIDGVWLSKASVNADPNNPVDREESAYALPPINKSTIMFRPLKFEGYTQFGTHTFVTESNVDDYSENGARSSAGTFFSEPHKTQVDKKQPVSIHADTREVNNGNSTKLRENTNGLLRWGKVRTATARSYFERLHINDWFGGDGPIAGTMTGPRYEWPDPNGYGNNKFTDGANAFGVITAYTTVAANTSINFSTTNFYGQGYNSYFRSAQLGGGSKQERSWGTSTNSAATYKLHNCPDLSVRLYQSHPTDQTIYDPIFCGVHHFNAGVQFTNDIFIGTDGVEREIPRVGRGEGDGQAILGDVKRDYERKIFTNINDKNGNLLTKVFYDTPVPSAETDFRYPSRWADWPVAGEATGHADGARYESVGLLNNTFIYLDATYDSDFRPPLMPEAQWQVNTVRTGKLLPFAYKGYEFAGPVEVGDFITPLDYQTLVDNGNVVSDVSADSVILVSSEDWNIGDFVGINSANLLYKVSDVDATGGITELECVSRGTFADGRNTRNRDDGFGEFNSTFKLERLTSVSDGAKIDAFLLSVKVVDKTEIDPKPYMITKDGSTITRIADPQTDQTKTGTNTFEFGNSESSDAFVSSEHETDFPIPETLRDGPHNRRYDVFFHFHNDITMTWLASNDPFHGNISNLSDMMEQFITAKILPT